MGLFFAAGKYLTRVESPRIDATKDRQEQINDYIVKYFEFLVVSKMLMKASNTLSKMLIMVQNYVIKMLMENYYVKKKGFREIKKLDRA
jgi:hypothetical protein